MKNDYSTIGMMSSEIIPLPLVARGRGGVQSSQKEPHPVFASLRRPSPQGGGKESPAMTWLVKVKPE
jgi:hypothetical protein